MVTAPVYIHTIEILVVTGDPYKRGVYLREPLSVGVERGVVPVERLEGPLGVRGRVGGLFGFLGCECLIGFMPRSLKPTVGMDQKLQQKENTHPLQGTLGFFMCFFEVFDVSLFLGQSQQSQDENCGAMPVCMDLHRDQRICHRRPSVAN